MGTVSSSFSKAPKGNGFGKAETPEVNGFVAVAARSSGLWSRQLSKAHPEAVGGIRGHPRPNASVLCGALVLHTSLVT